MLKWHVADLYVSKLHFFYWFFSSGSFFFCWLQQKKGFQPIKVVIWNICIKYVFCSTLCPVFFFVFKKKTYKLIKATKIFKIFIWIILFQDIFRKSWNLQEAWCIIKIEFETKCFPYYRGTISYESCFSVQKLLLSNLASCFVFSFLKI